MTAPVPANESKRLAALRHYDVLDTPPEQAFDDLTMIASQICNVPIALVSLVDERRQWFKSKVGMSASETSRDIAFCAHTILHADEVFEVRDAQSDSRFVNNPLVTTDPHIRFYAGAPLVAPDGHALGALCVMDRTPRAMTPEQLAALRALSRHVVAQLEYRRQTRELAKEVAERERAETLMRQQFEKLTEREKEADQLLTTAEKSRRALLSVLEDEKQIGHNLRASEERFRQLAENINEVFWITDPAKTMLYISPAYEKIWGRTCQSLYASPQTWLDAIHPADRQRVLDAATARQARGDYNETYRIQRPDGSIRWIQDRAFPLRNAAGEVYRVVGTASDITEQRTLEDQLRQAQKMEAIGQLAGGVAHDFNNILAVIQMQADLLAEEGGLTPSQQESASEVGKAAQRAASLTRQLLMFSRKQTMQSNDIDLNDVTINMSKMLHRILGEDIQMQFKYAPHALQIHADAGMIEQILMNLVVNARDAMASGGRLIIETTEADFDEAEAARHPQGQAGSFACLTVSDTGCGMAPHIMARIFEPFFTTKDVGKGTGLGLATVFGIVQQHQGWMSVYSEVDVGTTFRVYLPRTQKAEVQKITPSKRTTERGGGEVILVVEDDPSLRATVRIALSRLGYQVLESHSGLAALEVWKQNRDRVRLLLTDLVMPDGVNGLELGRRVVQDNPKLKVIYASGYSGEIVSKDFPLQEGVNFLAKPYDHLKLAQTVRARLDEDS